MAPCFEISTHKAPSEGKCPAFLLLRRIDYNGTVPISTGMKMPVITGVTFWGNFSSFCFVMQMERHTAGNSNDRASARTSLRLPDVPADLQRPSGEKTTPLFSQSWDTPSFKNGFLHVFNLLLSSKPKHHAWPLSKHFPGVAVPAKKATDLNLMSPLRDTEIQLGLDGCPDLLSSCCTPNSFHPSRARLVHSHNLALQPQLPTH